MSKHESPLALVTGASSGIGEATARAFARQGWRLALCARRKERLLSLRPALRELGSPHVLVHGLDVRDEAGVKAFAETVLAEQGCPDVLVNNAGLARGTERVDNAEGTAWREMVETNIFGLLYLSRAFLPAMEERKKGQIIMIGSVAGWSGYAGGSVYCATKAGVHKICEALRLETLGMGIRVSSIDPGMVDTEFSEVRFWGDKEKASQVYEDFEPLHAQDIADCVLFVATRPPHVNIDRLLVMPTAQADPWHVARSPKKQS
ncbi:MAG TPA: SDR family NAD(P)-dependent oxidoreductase [Planctomycetes bacterium]|nr:SDR family NAD(P)-dependent oxidoreductase [Planctomycetota bacterium]